MFLTRLYRFFLGYVEFTVGGGFTERFLNLCNINSVLLWDITAKDGVITAFTDINTYKTLHKYARKTGCKVKIKRKVGTPFLSRKYKHRIGLAVGLVVFLLVLGVCNSFIWSVEVEGNERVDDKKIISYYEQNGLKKGMKASKIKSSDFENMALADFPEIAWISINVYGTKAVIEIRESVEPVDRLEKEKPCNIKASVDATIVSMEVYDGFSMVKLGDAVLKGDLLVSAVSESTVTKNTFFKHSNGTIIGKTQRDFTIEVPKKVEEKEYSDKKIKRNYLTFFLFKIPLYIGNEPDGNFEIKKTFREFQLFGTAIPMSFTTQEYVQYTEKERDLTEVEMKGLAQEQIKADAARTKGLVEIQQSTFDFLTTENGMSVTGHFVLLESIGVTEEIQIENVEELQ